MNTNAAYTNEYLKIVEELGGDILSRRAMRSYILASTAYYHGKPIQTTYLPRFYDKTTFLAFKELAEKVHTILGKVMQRYIDDPEYRKLFAYDERLVDLICIPRGYPDILPFMRLDIFFDEDAQTARFCEINADGSSGMNEMLQVHQAFVASAALEEFASRHEVAEYDLFHPWLHKFLDIYSRFPGAKENPRIAIADYLEHGTVDEFKEYARQFTQHGIECHIVDVRNLVFDGEELRTKEGMRIDAIWRRAVTNDIIDNWDESQDFIEAVRAQKVALIGSFASHVIHDKQIFTALHDPATHAFLEPEEVELVTACVPMTFFLNADDERYASVRADKDRWIIKPTDKYGAFAVFAGCDYTQEEWEEVIDQHVDGAAGMPYIAQEYVTPYKTDVIAPCDELFSLADDAVPTVVEPYNNLTGLYLFNGEFAGVYTRLGPEAVICDVTGDVTSAAFFVDCD